MSKDNCSDFHYKPACFLKLQQPVFVIENRNHYRIITAIVLANGQTWDRVKTLSDRNASDFQCRAQSSGSRLFGDFGVFGVPKTAKPNTEIHRNTPKHTERSGGCRGQRDMEITEHAAEYN